MAAASQNRASTGLLRDRISVAWAVGGLSAVVLVTIAVNGAGSSSLFAIAVAASYAFVLSAALVGRNSSKWRRVLARIENETRRRLASSVQASQFSAAVFLERLGQECRRSARYKLDLSVIRLRCNPEVVAALGTPDEAGAAVLNAAAAYLRSEDVVGRLTEIEFAFFLPHTGRAGAQVVLNRLAGLEDLVETLGAAAFGDDGNDPNQLLIAAEADALRRLRAADTHRGWNQRAILK